MAYMESRRHIATLANIILDNSAEYSKAQESNFTNWKEKYFEEVVDILLKENARGIKYRHRKVADLSAHKDIRITEAIAVNLYQAYVVIQGFECQVAERFEWEKDIAYNLLQSAKENIIDSIISNNVSLKYFRL